MKLSVVIPVHNEELSELEYQVFDADHPLVKAFRQVRAIEATNSYARSVPEVDEAHTQYNEAVSQAGINFYWCQAVEVYEIRLEKPLEGFLAVKEVIVYMKNNLGKRNGPINYSLNTLCDLEKRLSDFKKCHRKLKYANFI